MSKSYQVLWIDDNPPDNFIGDAADCGIRINHFSSNEEGFKHLMEHFDEVDAVILDAISFRHKNQKEGTEDIDALDEALRKLAELRYQKYFPYFILSGQDSLISQQAIKKRYEHFYEKGGDDVERLFDDIKAAVDKQPEYQLRYRYKQAFDACSAVSEKVERKLLQVLMAFRDLQPNHQDDSEFNSLRIIIDEVLAAAVKQQILPEQCAPAGRINQKNSIDLLSGKTTKVSDTERATPSITLLPAVLAAAVNACLQLTSTASHGDRIGSIPPLTELRQTVKTPYLLVALTHQIMDFLVWYKELTLDSTRLASFNCHIDLTDSVVFIPGTVTELNTGRGGVFESTDSRIQAYIQQHNVEKHSLQINNRVEVLMKDSANPSGKFSKTVSAIRKLA